MLGLSLHAWPVLNGKDAFKRQCSSLRPRGRESLLSQVSMRPCNHPFIGQARQVDWPDCDRRAQRFLRTPELCRPAPLALFCRHLSQPYQTRGHQPVIGFQLSCGQALPIVGAGSFEAALFVSDKAGDLLCMCKGVLVLKFPPQGEALLDRCTSLNILLMSAIAES